MGTIYTVEGNTSSGNTLVANCGCVAKKSYSSTYDRIYIIYRPKYKSGEGLKVATEAEKYIGYLAKKSNAYLEDFTKNAGYNNYNMFAPDAKKATGSGVFVNGVPWSNIFVNDVLIRALGVSRTKILVYNWSVSCTCSSVYYQKAGATKIINYDKVEPGDIIFFKNTKKEICHVGIITSKKS